jgi:hypothetical protein
VASEFDELDEFDFEAQAAAEKARKLEQKRRAKEDADDWKWIMGQKRGRRMIWRQLERAGVFRSTFDENPHRSAFNEGQRNEGIYITDQIMTHCPEHWTNMMKENS